MPRHKADVLDTEDPARGISLRVPCLTALDEDRIRRQLAEDEFFWLDLTGPSEGEIERMGELFGLHELAIEDTIHFGQRPKLDDFGDHVFLVYYAAAEQGPSADGSLREVHLFLSGKYLITVRDTSKKDNFHLTCPGINKKTGIKSKGTAAWSVTLRKGTCSYKSDAHKKLKGSFKVK